MALDSFHLGLSPVCDTNWGMKEAQVVCDSFFGEQFRWRGGKVPAFEATNSSAFGEAKTDDFIMDEVRCEGDEEKLTDCAFVTHDQEICDRTRVAGGKCLAQILEDVAQTQHDKLSGSLAPLL